ncbi:ABC transporter ATP-binding protein [Clostridium sediminicola]|uniref:ABC transporter ATP-binding protein n=1 Tax=Clostridium sediminicola TaxID=3114879 RepID=UPI0031F1E891
MARNSVNNDEILIKHNRREIIVRLLSYLKPFRLKVLGIILMMIFVMVCGVINPYLLQICMDDFISNGNLKGLMILAVIMVIYNFIAMVVSMIRMRMMASVTNTVLINIRQELYSHIQKLTFSFFDNRPVGKILARVMGDVNSLQELFNNSITNFIPDLLNLLCVTFIMFYMNFRLALASIIVLPVLLVIIFVVETFSRRRWQKFRQKRSNFNAFTHESFSGVKIIQSFAVEKNKSKNFNGLVTDLMDKFMSAIRLNDLFWPVVELSWGIGSIVVYWYGTRLISGEGTLTVGTLVAFIWYVGMFWRPIINITQFYNTLITNFSAAERIFEIMDIEPDIKDIRDAIKMPKIKGKVEFKNVTFGYDDGNEVLKNINFKVKQGETVALVGPTGAGKTTIVNLLSRFYDITKGKVLIDGRDVKSVELESLRTQMGIMLQDTFLFSTTIMENIRYGKLDATDEEVIEAAKAVNAHGFINKLEKGYDTEVNERGSRLSVGQRQLISFARALLANPRILILDEATSNIDTTTERLVQRGIEKLLYGRTSFVIAHRLSTIRDCDRIMVIADGKIKESGTHDELMLLKGMYYDLYVSQYRFLSEGA